jgi:hypothetical protein
MLFHLLDYPNGHQHAFLYDNFYARYFFFFSLVNQTLRVSLRTAGAEKVRQLGKLPRFVKGGRNDRARRCVSLPTVGAGFWVIVVGRI